MNPICPKNNKVCLIGCESQCAEQPEVNPAARAMPEEKPLLGISSQLTENLGIDTNFTDEIKITFTTKL